MVLEVACVHSSATHKLLTPVRNGTGMTCLMCCVDSDLHVMVLDHCSPLDCSGYVGYHACYHVQLRVLHVGLLVKSIICSVVLVPDGS